MTEDFKTNSNEGEVAGASAAGDQVSDSLVSNQDANIAARRRLLRAGLIAGPLLVTLRGRPARAQLPSLGSAEIFYGAYVTQDQVDNDPNFDSGDLGKALNSQGDILNDESRRSGN